MAFVDVQLIDGLGLPYIAGAEAGLADPQLDPLFDAAWQGLLAAFPGLSLQPLFDSLPVEQLADLVDAVRLAGNEPPDPFVWFTLPCEDAAAQALATAASALPMVRFAGVRDKTYLPVSYGTNPDAQRTLQIQPSPNGVDAVYAWDVAGGSGDGARVADIESGWLLTHEELIGARVRKLSVFGSALVDHGTGVVGIVAGSDNGVGTIGIAPGAAVDLVTEDRGGVANRAAAIAVATANLSSGDILLIEGALPFTPTPEPAILVEFDPAVQAAIGIAVGRGITVIEPAGNGGVDLDQFPFLAHTRPDSLTFSGAIVVGAGEFSGPPSDQWARTFSSFGSRVDCFAAGAAIRAPAASAPNAYQSFSGTSGASAIIAASAALLQSMTRAATGGTLLPADVRRLFRSASLGVLPDDPLGARIGAMPDLRKIIRAQGLARVLPVAGATSGGDALFIVHLDADNRMVRRHWTFFTGWGRPLTADPPNDRFELVAAQPAAISTEETQPLARLRHDAFFGGAGGIQHMFWDSLGQQGDVSKPVVATGLVAEGRAVAVALPTPDRLLLAATNPQGRLVVFVGDLQTLLAGMSAPLVLDSVASYRRVAGPVLASRGAGSADVVAIEDGGSFKWYTGNVLATVGTGWSGAVTDPSGVAFEPGARPALLALDGRLIAAAVGSEGWLRAIDIDPASQTIAEPVVVDVQATIDTLGPLALALAGNRVVVIAVDTERVLRAATRAIAGGDWTPLLPIVSDTAISPLGGVTAVSIDLGVMAIAVDVGGTIRSALSANGLEWTALAPLSPLAEPADFTETSPLRSARLTGDPVLRSCLAGEHRMMAGEDGLPVMRLQQALIDLGQPVGPAGADGAFGPDTGAAVAAYKADKGLVPDDPVVGPGTTRALDADLLFEPPGLDPTFAEFSPFVVEHRLEQFVALELASLLHAPLDSWRHMLGRSALALLSSGALLGIVARSRLDDLKERFTRTADSMQRGMSADTLFSQAADSNNPAVTMMFSSGGTIKSFIVVNDTTILGRETIVRRVDGTLAPVTLQGVLVHELTHARNASALEALRATADTDALVYADTALAQARSATGSPSANVFRSFVSELTARHVHWVVLRELAGTPGSLAVLSLPADQLAEAALIYFVEISHLFDSNGYIAGINAQHDAKRFSQLALWLKHCADQSFSDVEDQDRQSTLVFQAAARVCAEWAVDGPLDVPDESGLYPLPDDFV
ncbi:S8 family serine peptidase [Paraburkholderia hospita]|uniref:Serine protease n=1 Tax=Paraburkholderia hospita TaxID=169430 RepID=A0AAN1MNT7_9BURK|nr:S8 family serine peptidase [Paraburkholderia hospita]AUT74005.1 serine protease [Paraburkholderia hospita]EIN02909.1 serine protease, subtilase family protein [Paraburkholderia hospita]OUL78728.1 serine protease [Paraburkholderia hospita]OUL85933.1 serine protease [Paraburkholderia hospita]SEH45972.1 Putative peptidoglycan binding domain-containing protein [Paraburkholderia hospita]